MAQTGRQFVNYAFYKLDPAWRRLSLDQRECSKRELIEAIDRSSTDVLVRSYSLVGIRGDVDLMLWRVTEAVERLHDFSAALNRTVLGSYLTTPYNLLATTKRSIYVTHHQHEGQEGTRARIRPVGAPYLVVYPFVKTRPWYVLSKEDRQKMMDVHIEIGHRYPSVKINTSYSFGLDDQEFVVAFETPSLMEFLDLVMDLRETDSSLYTLRDTPSFTCLAMELPAALDALG